MRLDRHISHFAEMMRDVAATRLSVRFVLGFGTNLHGVVSLEEAMADGTSAAEPDADFTGLITLTACANQPVMGFVRHADQIVCQGAMAVLTLSLDRSDVLLKACPFTGPVGRACAAMIVR